MDNDNKAEETTDARNKTRRLSGASPLAASNTVPGFFQVPWSWFENPHHVILAKNMGGCPSPCNSNKMLSSMLQSFLNRLLHNLNYNNSMRFI